MNVFTDDTEKQKTKKKSIAHILVKPIHSSPRSESKIVKKKKNKDVTRNVNYDAVRTYVSIVLRIKNVFYYYVSMLKGYACVSFPYK